MHKSVLLAMAGLFWFAAQGLALAATSADTGKAVGVDPSAEASLDKIPRTLVVGSDVAVGETVSTGPDGQVQLVFKDQTKLVVGPGSSLLVEAYLLRQDKSVGQFTVSALSGSFRFITGHSDHDAYLIKTPTGIIGVRGTAFDFNVTPGQDTTVVLYNGAVHLCNLDNRCVDLTKTCDVGSMASDTSSMVSPADQTKEDLRSQFRWVQSDEPLLADFRLPKSGTCLPETDKPAVVKPTSDTPSKPSKPTHPTHPTGPTRPSGGTHHHVDEDCTQYGRNFVPVLQHGEIVCVPRRARHRPTYDDDDDVPQSLIHINPFRHPRHDDGGYGGSSGSGSGSGFDFSY